MPKIRLENVSKSVEGKLILDSISMEIPDKSLYCILGPAGSGKSMVMRIIAGLERPDTGRVIFDERDVTSLGPVERRVAVVFQDFALYPHITAFDNIASPLMVMKVPKGDIRRRVEEIARYLKIDHRLTHYPSELSGGEKQRVAIARALVKGAEIILLDEPLVRLDYKIREDMRAELYRLQKEIGKNIILITSDPLDAMSLGEGISIIESGKIVQMGSMKDIYEKPVNVFVGRYFGVFEMNIFRGEVLRVAEGAVLRAGVFKLNVKAGSRLSDNEVNIGLRPEHLAITELDRSKKASFKGKILLSEVIGSDTIVHVDAGFDEPLRIAVPTIYRKRMGEIIEVGFNPDDVYIFSKGGDFLCRGSDLVG